MEKNQDQNVSNNSGNSGTRLLGFRLDPDHPRKITPQVVSEEMYFAIGRPIWRHQKKMQAQGRCALNSLQMLWKCDGDCELCDFQCHGRCCSLDMEIEDNEGESCSLIDKVASNDPTPETAAVEKSTAEQLLNRLAELCPEAIRVGKCKIEGDLSTYKALQMLDIVRSTYRYQISCAEKQLCEEFGVKDIRELL